MTNQTAGAQLEKKVFAELKQEFRMTQDEIQFLQSLPDNLPDTKLKAKQVEEISSIYYKYIANKVYRGWGQDLAEFEQKSEKWPSGNRVKRHEAQRMILDNLMELNLYRDNMSAEEAARKFYSTINCRESYCILVSKVYNVSY